MPDIEHPDITRTLRTGYPVKVEQVQVKEQKTITQLFHVYECQDCVLTFAIEQDYEDQSEVCCPVCQDENLRDVASGEMEIKK